MDGPNGDDDNDGFTRDTALASIQKGIDWAWPADTVMVADGTYTGPGNRSLNLHGYAITVRSVNGPDATVIDCEGSGRAFSFCGGEGPDTVVDGLTITGGEASRFGGAMFMNYNASPTISNCIISRNRAWDEGGSGIYCYGAGNRRYDSAPHVINCVFEGNVTTTYGGAIRSRYASPKIVNCTFTANQADKGSATFCQFRYATMVNSIVWGNGADPPNVLYGSVTASYCDMEGGWPGMGNIDVDPLFVDPCSGDYRLLPDSPCIDAGTNDAAYLPDTDLAGRARIVDGDCNGVATVDMGAYEFIPADVGDLDADCDVDLPDLSILAPGWRSEEGDADYPRGHDINWPPDGRINWRDILVLTDNWLMAFGP